MESTLACAFEVSFWSRLRSQRWHGRRHTLTTIAALAATAMIGLAPARAEFDPWSVVPDDTRIVMLVDAAGAARQPRAREALGNDAILAQVPSRKLPASERSRQVIAFVRSGQAAHPIVLTSGTPGLSRAYEKLRGAKVESVAGRDVHAATPKGWVAAALDPACIVEGPLQTVRAVLEQASRPGKSVATLPADKPARRLLGPGTTQAVSLLYFSPGSGTDLYSILQEIDGALHAELGAAFADYQSALKMLGSTQGVRLDLGQNGDELATNLRLAMPSSMAASFASKSLLAAKELARAASGAAVQSGKMTEADASMLEETLNTLQTQANGGDVLVQARVADPNSQRGER